MSVEDLSLNFKFRLMANVEAGTVTVSVDLNEVGVHVDVTDADLRKAVVTAAERCALKLDEIGYFTTPENIVETLERNLEEAFAVGKN